MDELAFQVLGPVTILQEGGAASVGGRRTLALLAGLLLSANEVVPVSAMMDWVWGEDLPVHPRASLHNIVARLRRELGRELIEATSAGYRAVTDMEHLDLLKFRGLTAGAASYAAQGRSAEAASQLAEALGLWREPLLGNIDSPVLCREETGRLTELYLGAQERHAQLCRRLGWHESAIEHLTGAVRAHPFREPLVGELMLALLASGRRADALAVYDSLRCALREELGVDPCPDLQQLHIRMLRSAPPARAARPGRPRRPEPRVISGQARDMPAAVGRLYGRARELDRLTRQLAVGEHNGTDCGPVAIVGPAGAGKTALAIHAAVRVLGLFPDGHLYLNLRGYDEGGPMDTAAAVFRLLCSLGAAADEIPADELSRVMLYRRLLANRRMLLILDNTRDSRQARPLLPGAAAVCRTIVTSRSQLRGLVAREGAHRVSVAGIPAHAGRALLADLLGLHPGVSREAVAELVERCDRLPLALRILAEHAGRNGQTLAEVLNEIHIPDGTLDLLDSGDGETAMRAVLSSTYRALDPVAARTYRVLGRHTTSSFSLSMAAAMLGQPQQKSRRLLDPLIDVHLLQQRGPGEYRLTGLVHAHARECSRGQEQRPFPAAAGLGAGG